MKHVVTFTKDELIQMLEGGEINLNSQALMYNVGVAISMGQQDIIFKMEEKDE